MRGLGVVTGNHNYLDTGVLHLLHSLACFRADLIMNADKADEHKAFRQTARRHMGRGDVASAKTRSPFLVSCSNLACKTGRAVKGTGLPVSS